MIARATNPTSSMLLDKSTAKPGDVDMAIFGRKSDGASKGGAGQGSVNPNYLKECREDNPEPSPGDGRTESVILGNCKITTPPDNLVINQPFEMAVEAKTSKGTPSGQVTFRLFCTIPDCAGGPPKCEDQSLSFSGMIVDGVAKASGKLISPKKPVASGTKLQYHVVAKHPEAKEKCESPKVEVESGKPPKPVAVWSLGAVHFGFDSSFILPSAAAKIAEFKEVIAKHPGAAVAVFGHADPVGEDDNNKGLSGRRAFAVWCLLAKDPTGWTQLASADKWDLRTTQTMLARLKDKAASEPYYGGSIDCKTGPKTESAIKAFRADHSLGNGTTLDGKSREALYKAYMESVCEVTCKPEDFVGDPKDTKRQWACVGCSEFNPMLVFGKSDDAKFRNASDKTERNAKNATNRRATVFLFPPGTRGPGNVDFPCPAWSDGVTACRKQFFEDADKRRNPSDAERTWEKDKDTFACKFYAGISTEGTSISQPPATNQHSVHMIEMCDGLFRTNSAAILPEGESPTNSTDSHEALTSVGMIATVLRYNEENEGKKLFIAGHTDSAGSEKFNQPLSEERAKVALALLVGSRDEFADLCQARHDEIDITQVFDWSHRQYGFECKPTTLDRIPHDNTYAKFRASYNAWLDARDPSMESDPRGPVHIAPTGRSSAELWGAIFDLYEHNLREELGEKPDGVAALRDKIKWVDDDRKSLGFGEAHPIDQANRDNYRSQTNRRVEILFFDEGEEPDLAQAQADPAGTTIFLPGIYTQTPVDPMPSAKRWKAHWEVEIDPKTNKDLPARHGVARKMVLVASGLHAGQVVRWDVEQIVNGSMKFAVTPRNSQSESEKASLLFLDWYGEDRVSKNASAEFPKVTFTFTATAAGRRIQCRIPLPYGDSLDAIVNDATGSSLPASEFRLHSPWLSRDLSADASARITIEGIPPGGAILHSRRRLLT